MPDMPDFRRLTRDHNPDDPFEARRLVDAGARLGEAPGRREVGPMRTYPGAGGVARHRRPQRAGRDMQAERTRVPVPPAAAGLVLASDGFVERAGRRRGHRRDEGESAAEAAAAARAVMQRRGAHDDITIVVVDVPPAQVRACRREARGRRGAERNSGEGTTRPPRKEKASTGCPAARRCSLRGAEPPPGRRRARTSARQPRQEVRRAGGRHRQEGWTPVPKRASPRRTAKDAGTPAFHLKIKTIAETRAR